MWCEPATAVELALIQATEFGFAIEHAISVTPMGVPRYKRRDLVANYADIFRRMMAATN